MRYSYAKKPRSWSYWYWKAKAWASRLEEACRVRIRETIAVSSDRFLDLRLSDHKMTGQGYGDQFGCSSVFLWWKQKVLVTFGGLDLEILGVT